MTPQEAKRSESYDKGHMVELQKDAGPLAKGTLLKVERIDQRANVLHCTDHQGKPHTLHPREHKLGAYTQERVEFSPGDSIKFTQNHRLPSATGPGPEVKNGQRAEVSRAHASGTVEEIASLKTAVALCAQTTGVLAQCVQGAHGVPAVVTPTANATGVTVGAGGAAGVITGTSSATSTAGVALTFKDTPTLGSTAMTWVMSGTICDGGTRGLAPGQGDCP